MVSNPTLYRSIGLKIESGEEGTRSFNLGIDLGLWRFFSFYEYCTSLQLLLLLLIHTFSVLSLQLKKLR